MMLDSQQIGVAPFELASMVPIGRPTFRNCPPQRSEGVRSAGVPFAGAPLRGIAAAVGRYFILVLSDALALRS